MRGHAVGFSSDLNVIHETDGLQFWRYQKKSRLNRTIIKILLHTKDDS